MALEFSLPYALLSLRRARGLGLKEAARLAGVSLSSLEGWESGRQTPTGRSLEKVLDGLGAPARQRARLLAAVDPRYARVALEKAPLGPPLNLGTVLRAMRGRRGVTQADLARTLGVTQGAVAKWETGDSTPAPATLHEIGFALGATTEEAIALASARGDAPAGLPDEPDADLAMSLARVFCEMPVGLQEVVSLGYEAELWRRAAGDARWDPVLGQVLAYRANLFVMQKRYVEVPPVAERCLRLATTLEGRVAAVPAVNALTDVATRHGESPGNSARTLGAWAAPLPRSIFKAWLLGAQGMKLIRAGGTREGIELLVRARDMDEELEAYGPQGEFHPGCSRAQSLGYAYLAAAMPQAASDAIAPFRLHDTDQLLYARTEIACGRPLDEASLRFLRHSVLGVPRNLSVANLNALEEVERTQARLTGDPPAPFAVDPDPDEIEARRLWTAVPGAIPWDE